MDGLRAIACLIVLVFHALFYNLGDPDWLRGTASMGVWLFFVLSAFLLSMPLLRTPISGETVARYGLHRALRILPLFVLGLLGYVAAGRLPVEDLPPVLFMQAGWGHFWTIPVELAFYLLLPAVIIGLVGLLRIGTGSAIAGLAIGIGVAMLVWPPWLSPSQTIRFGYHLPVFLYGVLAAVVKLPRPSLRVLRGLVLAGALLLAVPMALNKAGLTGDLITGLYDKHFIFGAGWALIVYAGWCGLPALARPLSASWLVMVGKASYSIYVWHMLFVVWAGKLAFPFGTLAAVALALVAGFVSYRMIEMPIFALRHRIVLRRPIPGPAE